MGDNEFSSLEDRFSTEIIPVEDVEIVQVNEPRELQSVDNDFRALVEFAERRPRPPFNVIAKEVVNESRVMAETAFWSWEVWDGSVGKKVPIYGPTAGLAFALQRHFRNIVVRSKIANETEDEYVFRAMAIDLQSFATVERTYYQPKSPKHLRKMERKDPGRHKSMVIATGESKAQRNVLLKIIPQSLIDLAMETAIDRVRSEVNPESIKKMVVAFAEFGVTEEMWLDHLGTVPGSITLAKFAEMKTNFRLIRRGELAIEDAFVPMEENKGPGEDEELTPDMMKSKSSEESG